MNSEVALGEAVFFHYNVLPITARPTAMYFTIVSQSIGTKYMKYL